MLSYDKWKLLNESLGGAQCLGLGRKQSLGLVSNIPGIAESGHMEGDCAECGEDMRDDQEELEGEVDLEDYSDEYDDTEEVEDEVDAEDEEIDDETDEEEDEYDDETEGEDDDEMPEEDEMEVEDEEEEDSDGDEEWEDEDVEYEDEDSDGDPENSEMGMGSGTFENKKSGDKVITESEWWKSVTNQIGKMTPSGNIIVEEEEVEEEEIHFNKLPQEFRAPVKMLVKRINPDAGEDAGRSQLLELIHTMLELALSPVVAKGMSKSTVTSALRRMVNDIFEKHSSKE
jgi:hypothetical protein